MVNPPPQLSHVSCEMVSKSCPVRQASGEFQTEVCCAGARLFKPKNHFACHFPVDILHFGPVRHYWCMRFEALNQLFKAFAKGGSFRNTCGRLAKIFSYKSAISRTFGHLNSYGRTREMSISRVMRYEREFVHRSSKTIKFVLTKLFSLDREAECLHVQWIYKLLFRGSEINAGEHWVSATLATKRQLAFIPKNGIFKFGDKIYLVLQLYPTLSKDGITGLPTTTIPPNYTPAKTIVSVESSKLRNVVALWPSCKVESESGVLFRFVSNL